MKEKVLTTIFLLTLVVVFFEIGYLLKSKKINKPRLQNFSLSSQKENKPEKTIFIKFIPLEKDDQEGRKTLYTIEGAENYLNQFGRINVKYDFRTLITTTGVFEGWEIFSQNEKKYLKIKDPKSGITLPLSRVIPSSLNQCPPTQLKMLLLNKIKEKGEGAIKTIKKFSQLSEDELNNYFQKGDVVSIIYCLSKEKTNVIDEKKVPIAKEVIIRRYNHL